MTTTTLTHEQQIRAMGRSLQGAGARKIATEIGPEVTVAQVRWFLESQRRSREVETRGDETPRFGHAVLYPDSQWPYEDEGAEAALHDYIERTQPDKIVHVGDAVDLYSLASFRKKLAPSQRMYLAEEMAYGKAKFQEIADLAPDAELVLIEGNHEDRLRRYLEEQGGELFDLVDEMLSLREVYRLDPRWDIVGPYHEGTWLHKPGGLWVTHGDYVRKGGGRSAHAHVERFGHSVAHGHSHRLAMVARTTVGGGTIFGFEVGTIADPTRTPRSGGPPDWQHGFCIVWYSLDTPDFHAQLVPIVDGRAVVNGVVYGS